MEDDEVIISSNLNNKPSIPEAQVDDDEDSTTLHKCQTLKESNSGAEAEGGDGAADIGGNEVVEIIESKAGEEKGGGGSDEGVESKELVLESTGNCEVECGAVVVDQVIEEKVEDGGGGGEEKGGGVGVGSDEGREVEENCEVECGVMVVAQVVGEEVEGGGGSVGSAEGREVEELGLELKKEVMGNSEVECGVKVVDQVVGEKMEAGDRGGEEKGGGGSDGIDEGIEAKELGLESGEELMGNCEVEGPVEGSGGMVLSGEEMVAKCDVMVVDQVMEEKVEEADGGGEEKGGGGSAGIVVEMEAEDSGLESEKLIGNSELAGSVVLSREGNVTVVDQVSEGAVIASQGGDKVVSDLGGNDSLAVSQGDGVAVAVNLLVADTVEVVNEKNVNTEIVEMSTMEMDIRADGVIGDEDGVVHKVDDRAEKTTADCDDTMDGIILVEQEKMVMDICVESSMRMGEGSNSEHASMPCDAIVGTEATVVDKVEKDEVEEAETEETLADVAENEKEKQVELVESDVSKYEKDDVKGRVRENDEFKDMEGTSLLGDNKLDDDEMQVGMNVEECIDSKEEDSESTVSESHADKSGKDDEAAGTKEIETGDIKMKTTANTMEITKSEEPEATGDSDAPQTPQDEEMVAEEETNADTEVETETDVAESEKGVGGKRKRGKNRSSATPKSTLKARKTIEEDVCFICFDGGALVLCDRR